MRLPVKRIALGGCLTALCLILSYVESQVPLPFGVPGMKLGLSNLAVVFALYIYGSGFAGLINVMRILIAGFMFGNPFSILYSLAGGVLSLVVMSLLKRSGLFGIPGVSVAGGCAHNLGQLIVAAMAVESYNVFFYLPALLLSGAVTGFLIGSVTLPVVGRLKAVFKEG